VFYGAGFAWFLPTLPLAYSTYWYGGVPYYYANNAYYAWDPQYSGYVATDPPPVVGDPSGSAAAPNGALPQAAPGYNGPPPGAAPQSYPQGAPMQQPQAAPDPGPPPDSAPGSAPQAYPLPNANPAPTADPVSMGLQAQLNMHPRNGQSTSQESIDRRDCQQWATQQAGTSAANGSDYQRAMVACIEGRGYAVE
jgi:hypothetical protein